MLWLDPCILHHFQNSTINLVGYQVFEINFEAHDEAAFPQGAMSAKWTFQFCKNVPWDQNIMDAVSQAPNTKSLLGPVLTPLSLILLSKVR